MAATDLLEKFEELLPRLTTEEQKKVLEMVKTILAKRKEKSSEEKTV